MNQHKVDWFNQMQSYIKREKNLENELEQFLNDNPSIRIECNCEEATSKVRGHL